MCSLYTSKYLRSLEKQEKDRAKSLQRREAQAQVQKHADKINALKSVHLLETQKIDWVGLASALLPPPVQNTMQFSHRAWRSRKLFEGFVASENFDAEMKSASREDETNVERANVECVEESTDITRLRNLARRVLAGDRKAMLESLEANESLANITEHGSDFTFSAPAPGIVECSFCANGIHIIPEEAQSVSATGKLVSKAMPKAQFQELYQDYIASCVLRIAREVFATIPIDALIITALVPDMMDHGIKTRIAVISVIIYQADGNALFCCDGDPSDLLDSFQCRTNFKATRKGSSFQEIIPFENKDMKSDLLRFDINNLHQRARSLKDELE